MFNFYGRQHFAQPENRFTKKSFPFIISYLSMKLSCFQDLNESWVIVLNLLKPWKLLEWVFQWHHSKIIFDLPAILTVDKNAPQGIKRRSCKLQLDWLDLWNGVWFIDFNEIIWSIIIFLNFFTSKFELFQLRSSNCELDFSHFEIRIADFFESFWSTLQFNLLNLQFVSKNYQIHPLFFFKLKTISIVGTII